MHASASADSTTLVNVQAELPASTIIVVHFDFPQLLPLDHLTRITGQG